MLIDGQPARRSYSLVENSDASTYRIAVRLAPDSRGGSRGMWSLTPGARIEISNPASLLEIDWTRKNYCLIAGGIGITPITGIAAALRRRNIDAALHYAVKSRGDAAFLDELSALLGDQLIVHASDEGARLDLEATFRALPDDAIAIMCGPMRMLEAARRAWNDAGRAPADLRYETFGSSGLKPTAEFRVRLKGSDTELVVPQNSSMLDALNGAGFEVISDCQRGECGVCAVDVICRRRRDRPSRRVLQRPAEARQPQDLPLRVARDRCRHHRYAVPAGSGASLRAHRQHAQCTLCARSGR